MSDASTIDDAFCTIGRAFHSGKRVPATVFRGDDRDDWDRAFLDGEGLRMAFLNGKNLFLRIGNERCAILPPALVFLPRERDIELISGDIRPEDRVVYFHPRFIHDSLNWDNAFTQAFENSDAYLLMQFAGGQRLEERIFTLEPGLCRTVAELLQGMEETLVSQEDVYWPCRSRSFLLQALIISTRLRDNRQLAKNAASIPISAGLIPIQICILQNLHHKISVDQIATYFGTNRTSLQTKFRDQIGVSVRQYIIKTRIQAACVMLKNTSLAIAEIAERTGFSDETTFVRAFKKQTSLPPGEYRKSFVYPSYL